MKNNIGSLRKKKGLTMQELANLLGTSQQQVDRLEKSQRKLTAEWMEKLSKALACKPAELIDFLSAEPKTESKIQTALAKVIGAIETRFSNSVREFPEDEQYEISFKPAKKDFGKKFFALVVEGGSYKNYPENSELIFSTSKVSAVTAGMSDNISEFAADAKTSSYKFKIGKQLFEGKLVKSIRSE